MEILGRIGPDAADSVPALVDVLRTETDESIQQEAIHALQLIGLEARAAVPVLIDLLRKKEPDAWDVYYSVLDAIEAIGEATETVPLLLEILKDDQKDFRIRKFAALAMARVGPKDERVSSALSEVMEDDSGSYGSDLQLCAAQALGRMGCARAVPVLKKSLLEGCCSDPPDAARALGEIGPPALEALPALTPLLSFDNVFYRCQAAVAVWRIAGDARLALPALMDVVKEWSFEFPKEPLEAIQSLAEMGPRALDAVPVLCGRLGDPSCPRAAAEALRKIGNASVSHLVDSLRSEDWLLRSRAARVLGEIGPEAREAIPALEALAKDKEEDEEVSRAATEALAKVRK